ncbi:MAG: hypothetical protein DI535_28420 [Citrobacter freundii]|nr:MAG: hypothetical protein DI535_28420 [Citrobacter freundii]
MKRNTIFPGICIALFLLVICGFSRKQPGTGEALYLKYCTPCHGDDGTKGKFGAKNLRKSILADAELFTVISNGRKWMPSWKKKLDPDQITAVMNFIKGFRAK